MTRPSIHIVDDDPDIRDGLAWLFDSRGFHSATWDGGQTFLDAALGYRSDWGHAVVLLDVRMAPLSGLVTLVAAVKNGAWDFLEKPFHDNELVDRVQLALAAATAAIDDDLEARRLRLALASLSPREREVLDELVRGHYNKNIADHLGITPRTVEFHRANIFEKMGVSSAIELAHKLGRLQPMGSPQIID